MKILSAKPVKEKLLLAIKQDLLLLKKKKININLVTILNNDSYASSVYVKNKNILCQQLGIKNTVYHFAQTANNNDILQLIEKCNNDQSINGIFVQLPTSKNIDNNLLINSICPIKDVDCFNNINVGNLWTKKNIDVLSPCTPSAIIQLLNFYSIKLSGKHVVIVNRSNIVGKPLISLFLNNDATVTVCHSKTKNLKSYCQIADIVVCAIGKPVFFDHTFFKDDCVIIDVSINRNQDNKICGDVNIDTFNKNSNVAYTPVPGGIGPLTVLMLIKNLIFLTMKQHNIL